MSDAAPTQFTATFVAERLERALAAGRAEGAEAEALFQGFEGNLLRLAEATVTQASALISGRVMVRVLVDGRQGRAWTTDLSDAGLSDAARQAALKARATPPGAVPVALPEPLPLAAAPSWARDAETAALPAAVKREWLAAAFAAHRKDDLALAGRFHTGLVTRAVRSTRGVAAHHQGSLCDLQLSTLERPAGHRASASRARLDARIDRERLLGLEEEVRQECHRAHDPVVIAPGAWDVILGPAAVAELAEWLAEIAFSSQSYDDGLSFVAGQEGQLVTGEAVTLVDDASMPLGVGVPQPFDAEGLPKQRVPLVTAGRPQGVVHNSLSGRRSGCASTGHAHVSPRVPSASSAATHLHLAPGTASLEDLFGQVQRGLYVSRLHYVNGMIAPRRAVMTGLLRDAAFLIEDGRPTRAVQTLRFTDSILDAFARIPGAGGIGRAVEPHAVGFDGIACGVFPHVLVPGLRFTSGR